MPLLPPHTTLVLATHNAGKVREIGALLAPFHLIVKAAGDLGIPEPEETEVTFIGNALLKARHAAQHSGLPALADDSGLSVAALGGAPGIYSARWAGEGKDFVHAMQRVEQELKAVGATPNGAAAHFVCALALCLPDAAQGQQEYVFEGTIHGTLTFPPRGDKGFGYDPIFIPEGHTHTFAEMNPLGKHAMSHRARAFAKLTAFFQ